MHGSVGLHSALAIKRQRRLREEKKRQRERERRYSSPTTSQSSLDQQHPHRPRKSFNASEPPPDHRLASSTGMLHLGVVFLVLGLFMIGSGLLPDDMVTWHGGGYWNELVATGLFAFGLGLFLIVLNRVISKREEEDLEQYVQRQLTRSRSGHRLERDVETGCLTTKHHRRVLQLRREKEERGFTSPDDEMPQVFSPDNKVPPATILMSNGEAPLLEKILEEEFSEKGEDECRETPYENYDKEAAATTTAAASLSPEAAPETRELLPNGRHGHHHHHGHGHGHHAHGRI